MQKRKDKLFIEYLNTNVFIAKEVMLNIVRNKGKEDVNPHELTDDIAVFVNQYSKTFLRFMRKERETPLSNSEMCDLENIIIEGFMRIGQKYESFIPDGDIIEKSTERILELIRKTNLLWLKKN